MQSNSFDSLMDPMFWGKGTGAEREAARYVADTLLVCREWWAHNGGGIKPTASDLLAMAGMIMSRVREEEMRRPPA